MSELKDDWWKTEQNDEVATKRKIWQPFADALDGFDLDPAAGCEPTPIADERYTKEDDGLTQPWYGNVWLNPPFGDKEPWYKRLAHQYERGDVDRAVAIGQAGTDANWFQEYFSTADVLVFINGRDCYQQKGTENFASMLGLWNPTDKAKNIARSFGVVTEPVIQPDLQNSLEEYK